MCDISGFLPDENIILNLGFGFVISLLRLNNTVNPKMCMFIKIGFLFQVC